MKNFRVLMVIILLTVGAGWVDLPREFAIGNLKFQRPDLDLQIGPVNLQRNFDFREGLDLAGGTHLVLSADMSQVETASRNQALESLKGIIERRVDLYGVSEPVIQVAKVGGDYRVIVELAGIKDINQAIELVGQTAVLTFREATGEGEFFSKITELSGRDLKIAQASFSQNTSEPQINLTFTAEGAKKFEEITRRNLNKQVAIFLDDQILMSPTVQAVISGGQAVITGKFTAEQTKQYAILLNSGALPAPVKVVEQRTVGATLGQESVNKSVVAGLIGLGIVAIFMIVNYGFLGIIADLALIIYVLLSLAVFKLIPVTLTLAGITGFILSIGMAVDANILIFERMKEEIKWGKQKLAAVELGFARAFPSIRDSNANSLIICAILYWFGSGAVRGFAVMLAIGIFISLFTAITVTKNLLRLTKYV